MSSWGHMVRVRRAAKKGGGCENKKGVRKKGGCAAPPFFQKGGCTQHRHPPVYATDDPLLDATHLKGVLYKVQSFWDDTHTYTQTLQYSTTYTTISTITIASTTSTPTTTSAPTATSAYTTNTTTPLLPPLQPSLLPLSQQPPPLIPLPLYNDYHYQLHYHYH